MPDAEHAPGAELREAQRRLQDISKWLIGVFGGIGALIVAGTQLSSIGSISGSETVGVAGLEIPRLWIAISALIVALVGVAVAMLLVVRVQTAGDLSIDTLCGYPRRKDPSKAPRGIEAKVRDAGDSLAAAYLEMSWPQPAGHTATTPLDQLREDWRSAHSRAHRLRESAVELNDDEWSRDLISAGALPPDSKTFWSASKPLRIPTPRQTPQPEVTPGPGSETTLTFGFRRGRVTAVLNTPSPPVAMPAPPTERKIVETAVRQALGDADRHVESIEAVMNAVLNAASYDKAQRIFRRSTQELVGVVAIVAVGLGVFVWAANPPPSPLLEVEDPPATAEVLVPAGSADEVHGLIGDSCDLDVSIKVDVLARSDSAVLVKSRSAQNGKCAAGETFLLPARALR